MDDIKGDGLQNVHHLHVFPYKSKKIWNILEKQTKKAHRVNIKAQRFRKGKYECKWANVLFKALEIYLIEIFRPQ